MNDVIYRKFANFLAVGLVVFITIVTFERNALWQDELTIWLDIEKKSPNIDRVHYQLGYYFAEHNRIDDAIREYEATLDIYPNAENAYNNLGLLYEKKGRYADAFTAYQAALKINPENANSHNNIGLLYQKNGDYIDAMKAYKMALSIQPDHTAARRNLDILDEELKYNARPSGSK